MPSSGLGLCLWLEESLDLVIWNWIRIISKCFNIGLGLHLSFGFGLVLCLGFTVGTGSSRGNIGLD